MDTATILGIITAALQLAAVGFLVWDILETRKTTDAINATLIVAQEQLEENRKASKDLQEATIISQMEIEWDSFEMHESISLAMSLEEDAGDCLERWREWGGSRLLSHQSLEIPRFYDMLDKLVELGTISERMAVAHFGEDAEEYWNTFRPLIEEFRRHGGRYRKLAFGGFESFVRKVRDSNLIEA